MTNQVDIGVLRGLHAASTQGEWKLHKELCKYGDSDAVAVPNAKYGWCLILSGNHNFPDAAKADAAWAVAAHNALPALLDELERLRAALLACPGRQLMFCVVDGRIVVEAIPPDGEQIGPNAYRYNLRDFMAGGGGGEITGPIEGTNGGGQ